MNNNHDIDPVGRLRDLLNTPDERAAVRVVCRQILNSLGLISAPIPLKPICHKLNLVVHYNNVVKPEDSFLKLSPSGFEIEISKQKNWRRNRFTIAHELTHLILFKVIGSPINSFERRQHDDIENLCNVGASELLINEQELEKSLLEFGIGTKSIKLMYDKFLVSYDALFSKLSDYLNVNILVWRKYARSERDMKEYRVYNHFPKYKFAIKSIWLPNGCTVKHISSVNFEAIKVNSIIDNFNVIMNNRTTKCSALIFPLPRSRNYNNGLPMFNKFTVVDELIYDDCFFMLLVDERSIFEKIKSKYIKNEQ